MVKSTTTGTVPSSGHGGTAAAMAKSIPRTSSRHWEGSITQRGTSRGRYDQRRRWTLLYHDVYWLCIFYSVHLLYIYMTLRFVDTSINTHDDDDEALRIRRREPISTISL